MKYPRNRKEAENALITYRTSLVEDNPLMVVNLVSDIDTDMEEVHVTDAVLACGTPCEYPVVIIKSMEFDLCDTSKNELEINETYMEIKSFISAADAISQYISSRREISEILED